MAAQPRQRFTPEQYLALERQAETKSEYVNGEIFAMAGASEEHNTIAFNLGGLLYPRLRARGCRGYIGDMRLKVSATGLYTYPDVMIVCGERQIDSSSFDTLLNPTTIIEILSPTSEAYDRGAKFGHYRRIDSLREYLLVAQDQPHVERFVRQGAGEWLLSEATGLDNTIPLASIDASLSLAAIYEGVAFAVENDAGI